MGINSIKLTYDLLWKDPGLDNFSMQKITRTTCIIMANIQVNLTKPFSIRFLPALTHFVVVVTHFVLFHGSLLSLQSSAVEQVLDILMDILSWETAEVVSPCLPRGL